jgi:hypothetical protein
LGRSFPSDDVLTRLANQFAYASFEGYLVRPWFANFMSGANGWYRWAYLGREGFGYQPFDMTLAGLTGGFGFWGEYNSDVGRINRALRDVVTSEDPDIVAFRNVSVGPLWISYERTAPLASTLPIQTTC